jgi:CRISPR system Cascade subunit CasE
MYLSRLTLDPQHPRARRDLSSPYEMHRSLTRAFVADAADIPARFLWRHERDRARPDAATVLVQSAVPGRWSALEADDWCAIEADKPVPVERLVQAGRQFHFRLLANPTVTRDGKRHALHGDDERLAWLQRQGSRHGFVTLNAACSGRERLRVRQPGPGRVITLEAVLFDGVLRCTDPGLLRAALVCGIGPGKALGLGMLSVAPMAGR